MFEVVEMFPARLETAHAVMTYEDGRGWCVTVSLRYVTPAGHAEWMHRRYDRLVHDEAVDLLVSELGAATA